MTNASEEVRPAGPPRRLRGSLTARRGRIAGLIALCLYAATLALASLELVPLPAALNGVTARAGDAATLLRRASIIPGPALFHDRDATPIGVLSNCVEITGVTAAGVETPVYATSTCADRSAPSLLRGPLDKALVRLEFDALVFRNVPASDGPMSGDRILAAIGHQHCRPDIAELHILWDQAVEDRRDGMRDVVTRGGARWSCTNHQLIERAWRPNFDVPGSS